MTVTVKAIETNYAGYRFRSRLEARWAVFFNEIGVPFEYEKEGFDLGKDGLYLPDFWLPTVGQRYSEDRGVWIEIKGQSPDGDEVARCAALCEATGYPVNLFVGLPGAHLDAGARDDSGYEWRWHHWKEEDDSECHQVGWDNYMRFLLCHNPQCGYLKVEFAEGSYMNCPRCKASADDEHPRLLTAYAAARSARFEHGESPRRPIVPYSTGITI